MLRRIFPPLGSALLGLSVVLTAACDPDDPTLPTASTAEGQLSAAAESSNGDVVLLSNPATVVGQSHLTRTSDGIRANVRTSGLTPGDAVTLWIVVFQDPDQCVGACDSPPEDLAPGRAAVALAAGHVVPSSGKVTLAGKLDIGDELEINNTPAGPSADEFDTPMGSEVHLVVRTHGQAIPGMVEQQTGSFNGGCPPNACASIQAAVYQP